MNILTFDIEDWWVYDHYSIGKKENYLPRINCYLDYILDILDERNFKATFFCLGEVADKYSDVIKLIASRGHHIGCHSFNHRFFGNLTPEEIAEDTRKALDVIENIIGEKVTAYRAPAFSITEKSKWIFGILADHGIKYDCSIFPADRSFGGFPGFYKKGPSVIKYQNSLIREFPISVTHFLRKDWVCTGGGYFRIFPYWKIKSCVRESDYVMTYFHIKDFDKDQQRRFASFQGESAIVRYFKNYYGLNGSFLKFQKFLADFDFISVKQANVQINWDQVPINLIGEF